MKKIIALMFLLFLVVLNGYSTVNILVKQSKLGKNFKINTDFYSLDILVENGFLKKEIILGKNKEDMLSTNGNFSINLMFTGWRAPNTLHNSENPVIFDKNNFKFIKHEIENNGSDKILRLIFRNENLRLQMSLNYVFTDKKYYYRKGLSLNKYTGFKKGEHFLRKVKILDYKLQGKDIKIVKVGGYGQPVAFTKGNTGYFFGVEYPASNNDLIVKKGANSLVCREYIGENIGKKSVNSDTVIIGITPDKDVKKWFFKYLNDIRIVKLRPYTLYNSWYDLESPDMVKNEKNILNEKNVLRIYNLFKKTMFDKYGIKLDAFVLDDGWDVYESDWQIAKDRFPNGFKKISEILNGDGVNLGIWFGPIGGYSYRGRRIEWMREKAYETVGDQFCFGGEKYYKMFDKRVADFVKKFNVGYYKWDGFQFSCSNPNHGHPIGIYSRRHILNNLIKTSSNVRSLKSDIFLNITSGTWLSPWWLKTADQIWMQGYDYGYSGVPSISKRDMAMTYRDYVLFDDFQKNKFWFPIANLMTHGIIKGDLQKLGGEKEPIEKFTDNAVLYFARGVSMYELYITPDLLNDAEWSVLAKSIKWAKENFDILTNNNEMIGGNPGNRESYGFLHFNGKKGIIALRNPFIEEDNVKFQLKTNYDIDKNVKGFVLEKIYPKNWISPKLYKIGDEVEIKLEGYETAIYKMYPIEDAKNVLISNTVFNRKYAEKDKEIYYIYKNTGTPTVLNGNKIGKMTIKGGKSLNFKIENKIGNPFDKIKVDVINQGFAFNLDIGKDIINPRLAILIETEEKADNNPSLPLFSQKA